MIRRPHLEEERLNVMSEIDSTKRIEQEESPGKTNGRSKDLKDSISGSSFQWSGSSSAKVMTTNYNSIYGASKNGNTSHYNHQKYLFDY